MKINTILLESIVSGLRVPTQLGIVYGFHCIPEDTYYVGVTKHMITKPPKIGALQRLSSHLNALEKNRHSNKKFQEAYNKYGDTVFEYRILEVHPLLSLYDWNFVLDSEAWWHENLPKLYSTVSIPYSGILY